jgi:hypothetical protein
MKNLKIAVHITHYSRKIYEEEKILNKVIKTYLLISKNIKIFIHTNQKFISRNKRVSYIFHNIESEHPFYLSWKCRDLMADQKNDYDIYIYSENDILFSKKNFLYWKKYKDVCISRKLNLGFCRVEKKSNKNFLTDIYYKLNQYIRLDNFFFLINNKNPFCAFWIYDSKEFINFVNSDVWKFNWKKNYQCFNDIRAMSAIGWHGINMNRYHYTVIPLSKRFKILNSSLIKHLRNNYAGTFHGPGSLNLSNIVDIHKLKKINLFIDILKKKIYFFLKKKLF